MNIAPVSEGASALTLHDRHWLLCLRDLLRSHDGFLEGTRQQADDLSGRAAAVTVWRDGQFQTVRELVDKCTDHHWNRTIYEAWVWETGNRIRKLMQTLGAKNPIAVEAIEVHARHVGYFEASYGDAMQAIAEAMRWSSGDM